MSASESGEEERRGTEKGRGGGRSGEREGRTENDRTRRNRIKAELVRVTQRSSDDRIERAHDDLEQTCVKVVSAEDGTEEDEASAETSRCEGVDEGTVEAGGSDACACGER